MKVVRPSLKILLEKTKELDEAEKFLGTHSQIYMDMCTLWDMIEGINGAKNVLTKAAGDWIVEQDYRDQGWTVDQYHVQIVRNNLENAIIEYRKKLAEVYDFMGDRGLQ